MACDIDGDTCVSGPLNRELCNCHFNRRPEIFIKQRIACFLLLLVHLRSLFQLWTTAAEECIDVHVTARLFLPFLKVP